MFVEYNIPSNDPSWNNFKETYMVKITYITTRQTKESFWVWIHKIKDDQVIGIISNDLITYELSIGQVIKFNKKHIKEIANRSYTFEQTMATIKLMENNPITKYFNSLNLKFNR